MMMIIMMVLKLNCFYCDKNEFSYPGTVVSIMYVSSKINYGTLSWHTVVSIVYVLSQINYGTTKPVLSSIFIKFNKFLNIVLQKLFVNVIKSK